MQRYSQIPTPCGPLLLVINEQGLCHVDFCRCPKPVVVPESWQPDDVALAPYAEQFTAYFDGRLQRFDLPLAARGTKFQQQVWQALAQIPYGETRSYSEQATAMGQPQAVRAIGHTNGLNPVSIIVPCHRVIAKSGKLAGYAGGLAAKEYLLALEAKYQAPTEH